MFFDAALFYDKNTRSFDLTIGQDGDIKVDRTLLTPMLLSVELDSWAASDDPLPQITTQYLESAGINARRGTVCDCLDPTYSKIGSKCWLLERAKQTEETKLLIEMWLK